MTEEKKQHIGFIQDIITRMNTNSFQIKGWAITIISALFAIYASTKNESFLLICGIPILLFWGLDAFYLWQERLFRCIYENTIKEKSIIKLYEMKIPKRCLIKRRNKYCSVLFSRTILAFYFTVTLLIGGVYSYLHLSTKTTNTQVPLIIKIQDTIKYKNLNINTETSKMKENYQSTNKDFKK